MREALESRATRPVARQHGRPTDATAGELISGSCASSQLCVGVCSLGVCSLGVGAGGGNCQGSGGYESGSVLTWDPLDPLSLPHFVTLSSDHLTGVWCMSGPLCFTTDGLAPPGLFSSTNGPGVGDLFVSTDPTGTARAWTVVDRDRAGITALTCPGSTCLAVDAAGVLLSGSRPGSAGQIRAALQSALTAAARERLEAHGSSVLEPSIVLQAPSPGTLTIIWRATALHPARHASRVIIVGSVSVRVSEGQTSRLRIRLTRGGADLLRGRKAVGLDAVARFTLPGGAVITEQRRFRLRR
jgi:hypothetical protein